MRAVESGTSNGCYGFVLPTLRHLRVIAVDFIRRFPNARLALALLGIPFRKVEGTNSDLDSGKQQAAFQLSQLALLYSRIGDQPCESEQNFESKERLSFQLFATGCLESCCKRLSQNPINVTAPFNCSLPRKFSTSWRPKVSKVGHQTCLFQNSFAKHKVTLTFQISPTWAVAILNPGCVSVSLPVVGILQSPETLSVLKPLKGFHLQDFVFVQQLGNMGDFVFENERHELMTVCSLSLVRAQLWRMRAIPKTGTNGAHGRQGKCDLESSGLFWYLTTQDEWGNWRS
jgi:hypothetical protein